MMKMFALVGDSGRRPAQISAQLMEGFLPYSLLLQVDSGKRAIGVVIDLDAAEQFAEAVAQIVATGRAKIAAAQAEQVLA